MEASTSGQGSSNSHLEVKCKVCEREFSADVQPRMLPCLHTVCAQCLANVTNNTALASGQQMTGVGVVIAKCPICKDDIRSTDDIIEDTWTVPQATAQAISGGEMLCTNCDDNVVATNFCVDCQGGLCDPCVSLHRKVRILKDHVIQPRSEENNVQRESVRFQPPFCPIHPKERLQLYCENCVRLTCRDCQLVSHKEHKHLFLTEAAANQRLNMRRFISELQDKRANAKIMKNSIQVIYKKMKDQEAMVLSRIDEVFTRIANAVTNQGTALKNQVRSETDAKCRALKQQLVEVGTVDSALSQCYRCIHNIITSENDVAALQQNRLVRRRVDLVLRTLLTRQPVTELVLQFKPTNLPNVDVFRRIGAIDSIENKMVIGAQGQVQMRSAQGAPHVRPNQGFPHGVPQNMPMNRAALIQQQMQQQMPQGPFAQRPMGELARVNRSTVRAPMVQVPRQPAQHQQQARPPMQANILPVLSNQQPPMGMAPNSGLPTALQQVPGPPNVTVTNNMTFGDLTTAQMIMMAKAKQMNPTQQTTGPTRQSPHATSPPAASPASTVRNTNSASPSSASPSSVIAPADDNSGPRIVSVKSERKVSKSDSERPSCRFHNQSSSSSSSSTIGNGLQDNQPSSSGLDMQQGSEKTSPAIDVQMGGDGERIDQATSKTLTPTTSSKNNSAAGSEMLGIDLPVPMNASDIIGDIMDEVALEAINGAEDATGDTSGSAGETSGDGESGWVPESPARSGEKIAAAGSGTSSADEAGAGGSDGAGDGAKETGGGASGSGSREESNKETKTDQSGIQEYLNEMDDIMHEATKESIAAFWKGNVTWFERDDQGKPQKQVIVGNLYRMTSKNFHREGWPNKLDIKIMKCTMLKPLIDLMRDHQLFFLKCDQEYKELYRKLVAIFKNKDMFGAIRLHLQPEIILLLFYSHKHQKFYIVCPQKREQFSIGFLKAINQHFKLQPKQAVQEKRAQDTSAVSNADNDPPTSDATAPSSGEKRGSEDEEAADISRNGDDNMEPIPTWKQGYKLRNSMQCSRSDDPNDDWCAVCNNGGDLVCCDRCPRVYHNDCHVPVINDVPEDDFNCTLCFDVTAEEEDESNDENTEKLEGFTAREFKLCQRLLLEMYCLEDSQPFLEPVGKEVVGYHEIIPIPMDLSTIKGKLSINSTDKYTSPRQMVDDLRVMFTNCYQYNGETSDLGKVAQHLQRYASRFMKRYLPEFMDSNFVSSATPRDGERPSKRRKQEHPTPIHIR